MWAVTGPVSEAELGILHVAEVFAGSVAVGLLLSPYSNANIVVISRVSPKWMDLCRDMLFLLLFGWFSPAFSQFHFFELSMKMHVLVVGE